MFPSRIASHDSRRFFVIISSYLISLYSPDSGDGDICDVTDEPAAAQGGSAVAPSVDGILKTGKDGTSDEEQAWLEALEAGELDDSGGLKKAKDPKLMTARQVGGHPVIRG